MAGDMLSMHKTLGSISSNTHKVCTCNIDPLGAGKIGQCLRMYSALAEGLSSIPSIYIGWTIGVCNSNLSFRGLVASEVPVLMAHIYTYRHICTVLKTKFWKASRSQSTYAHLYSNQTL